MPCLFRASAAGGVLSILRAVSPSSPVPVGQDRLNSKSILASDHVRSTSCVLLMNRLFEASCWTRLLGIWQDRRYRAGTRDRRLKRSRRTVSHRISRQDRRKTSVPDKDAIDIETVIPQDLPHGRPRTRRKAS